MKSVSLLRILCYRKPSRRGARQKKTSNKKITTNNTTSSRKRKSRVLSTSPARKSTISQSELKSPSTKKNKPKTSVVASRPGKEKRKLCTQNAGGSVNSSSDSEAISHERQTAPVMVEVSHSRLPLSEMCSVDVDGRFSERGVTFTTEDDMEDDLLLKSGQGNETSFHHGLDIQEYLEEGTDNDTIFSTKSYTGSDSSGVRYIFEVSEGDHLITVHKIKKRTQDNQTCNRVAFITATQLCPTAMKRKYGNLMIAYTVDGDVWNLGVVVNLCYRTQHFEDDASLNEYEGCLHVYQWAGHLTYGEDGGVSPSFFLATSQQERENDLQFRTINFRRKHAKLKICFLNQFCGHPPVNGRIADDVINAKDGCVQCSKSGPDTFPNFLTDRKIHVNQDWLAPIARKVITEKETGSPTAFTRQTKRISAI